MAGRDGIRTNRGIAKESPRKELDPRRFLRNATAAFAAAELATIGSADAQSSQTSPAQAPPIRPGTNTSFGPLKRVNAGVLSIAYAEAGRADGPPVLLLHGWPYAIHSLVYVAPILA